MNTFGMMFSVMKSIAIYTAEVFLCENCTYTTELHDILQIDLCY